MAESKTPESLEVGGEKVYRVPHWIVPRGYTMCFFCPLEHSEFSCGNPCGIGHSYIREDAWHKMKLRS